MAAKQTNSEKWLSWCEKFSDETKNVDSIIDIITNRYYKKLNGLKDQEFITLLINLLKKDIENKDQSKYLKLFPILLKFYPTFVIERCDQGKLKVIIKKLLKHIEINTK